MTISFNPFQGVGTLDDPTPKKPAHLIFHSTLAHDELRDKLKLNEIYYVITITFTEKKRIKYGDGLPFIFEKAIRRFMNSKKIKYYLVPEISDNGHYHLHGVITQVQNEETKIGYLKRYLNNNWGTQWVINRILDLYEEYVEYKQYGKKRLQRLTSYTAIYNYIHKDLYWKDMNIIKNL